MAETSFRVKSVGPLVSFQDSGRTGLMRYGVPYSGPMDRFSRHCACAALHANMNATVIEVSMAGLVLECEAGEVTVAITGANSQVSIDERQYTGWCVATIRAGQTLSIRAGEWGSFAYLAFAGVLRCNKWLDSTSTYTQSNLGGGLLSNNQSVVVDDSTVLAALEGPLDIPPFVIPIPEIHVVLGPQQRHFTVESVSVFSTEIFHLSSAFDRMGVRLEGPMLNLDDALSIPSEPVLRGSVQVSGEGVPTVLLADHQTTGGYPKIATLVSSALDRFTQHRAGDSVNFVPVSAETAILMAREHAEAQLTYLDYLANPRGSLEYRLMHENLIDGVISAD